MRSAVTLLPAHLHACAACGAVNGVNASQCWRCEAALAIQDLLALTLPPLGQPGPGHDVLRTGTGDVVHGPDEARSTFTSASAAFIVGVGDASEPQDAAVASGAPLRAEPGRPAPAAGHGPVQPPFMVAEPEPVQPSFVATAPGSVQPSLVATEPAAPPPPLAHAREMPYGRDAAASGASSRLPPVLDARLSAISNAARGARRRRRVYGAAAALIVVALVAVGYPLSRAPVNVAIEPAELPRTAGWSDPATASAGPAPSQTQPVVVPSMSVADGSASAAESHDSASVSAGAVPGLGGAAATDIASSDYQAVKARTASVDSASAAASKARSAIEAAVTADHASSSSREQPPAGATSVDAVRASRIAAGTVTAPVDPDPAVSSRSQESRPSQREVAPVVAGHSSSIPAGLMDATVAAQAGGQPSPFAATPASATAARPPDASGTSATRAPTQGALPVPGGSCTPALVALGLCDLDTSNRTDR